jgi:predicted dehydrogenase
VKIGQIGAGHAHASGKLATLRKLADEFEVVGVVEPDTELRAQAMRNKTYQDLPWMDEDELLAVPGLDAVAVETNVRDLVPVAARCVAAGKHLHLDKPAGTSLSAFRRVLDDADRQSLCVQMGYMFRHNPGFRFCFEAVRQGLIGEVFEVHGVISKAVGEDDRRALAEFDGGSMFELGCHLIDALVALLGKPAEVTPFLRRTRPPQDSLADNTLAVFSYPQATATVRSTLLEVDGTKRRQFVICGDRGTLELRPLEPPRLALTLDQARGGHAKGYQEIALPAMPGRYDDQLRELAQVVRGERAPEYGSVHDLAVQEAILRASGMA